MSSTATGRKYVSKGVSAQPEWWLMVENTAEELGMNKSILIRIAVEQYLKDSSAGMKQTLTVAQTP